MKDKEKSYLNLESQFSEYFTGVPSEISANITPEENKWYEQYLLEERIKNNEEYRKRNAGKGIITEAITEGIPYVFNSIGEGLRSLWYNYKEDLDIHKEEDILKRRDIIGARRRMAHAIQQLNLYEEGLGDELYQSFLESNLPKHYRDMEDKTYFEKRNLYLSQKYLYEDTPIQSVTDPITELALVSPLAKGTASLLTKGLPAGLRAVEGIVDKGVEALIGLGGAASVLQSGVGLATVLSALGAGTEFAKAAEENADLVKKYNEVPDKPILDSEIQYADDSFPLAETAAALLLTVPLTTKLTGKLIGRYRFAKTLKEAASKLPEDSNLLEHTKNLKSYKQLTKGMQELAEDGKTFDDWLTSVGLQNVEADSPIRQLLQTSYDAYSRRAAGGIFKTINNSLNGWANYNYAKDGALGLRSAQVFTPGMTPMMTTELGRWVFPWVRQAGIISNPDSNTTTTEIPFYNLDSLQSTNVTDSIPIEDPEEFNITTF